MSVSRGVGTLKPGICTSTTRPLNPYRGQTILETDTMNKLVYYGTTTGWRPEWNQPWGTVAMATPITAAAVATNTTLLSAGSVPFVLNRRYRISCEAGSVSSSVAGDVVAIVIAVNGVQQMAHNAECRIAGTGGQGIYVQAIYTAVATSSLTTVANAGRLVGSGVVTWGASTTQPINLIIEDIGPAVVAPPAS